MSGSGVRKVGRRGEVGVSEIVGEALSLHRVSSHHGVIRGTHDTLITRGGSGSYDGTRGQEAGADTVDE